MRQVAQRNVPVQVDFVRGQGLRGEAASRRRWWCRALVALPCLLSLAAGAHADGRGVYVGVQLFGARYSSQDGGDASAGLTLGYGLNQYLGVEASFKSTHFETQSSSATAAGIDGTELALRGSHALTDWLGVTAKAGAYHWRATDTVANGADAGTDAIVGAGLVFRVSERVSLSTEYERILGFDGSGEDDRMALGLRLDFD